MNLKPFFEKNGPVILTVLGVAGVIGTMITTAKCTPKAMDILTDCKCEGADTKETIKRVAPAYLPAAGVAAGTILCICSANFINQKQQAALLASYAWLERNFKKYRKKAEELYNKGADSNIVSHMTEDTFMERVGDKEPERLPASNDKCLWYDEFSERYFESTPLEVTEAELHLNRNFVLREYCTVNEFYDFLGIDPVEHGDDCGWSMFAGCDKYGYSWIDFDHELVTLDDGLECMVIRMPFEPAEDFLEG